jgi:hypothetical protein
MPGLSVARRYALFPILPEVKDADVAIVVHIAYNQGKLTESWWL